MKTKIAGCNNCDGEWDVDSFTILFCPLHDSARELLSALLALVLHEEAKNKREYLENCYELNQAIVAITKAEGWSK